MGLGQKLLIVGVVALGSVFGWRTLRSALASDEQKIRWVFEDMQSGFNRTRMAPVIRGFEISYRDESSGLTRDELREVLAYLFLREHDPETKRFRLRMELDGDALAVQITDETSATVSGAARFFELEDGAEQVFWDARFVAELVDGEKGWQVVRTKEVNVAEIDDLE